MVTLAIPVCLMLDASFARAQTLSGHINEGSTRTPIVGAYVILLDARGARVSSWLTGADGRYALTASSTAQYTVQIDRIGFRSFVSEPIALASSVARDFSLDVDAVQLPNVTSTSSRACKIQSIMTVESIIVWREVMKALNAADWTSSNRLIEYELVERTSLYDSGMRLQGQTEDSLIRGAKRGSPFAALASSDLNRRGFIQKAKGGHYTYFAPDAALIVSEDFQSSHCFAASIDPKRPDLVGLRFTPTGSIKSYDVTGNLWIDRRTGLLTLLEYSYNRLPGGLPLRTAGGEATFTRLTDGTWIVSDWKMIVPLSTRLQTTGGIAYLITGIQEKRQFVRRAASSGSVLYTFIEDGK